MENEIRKTFTRNRRRILVNRSYPLRTICSYRVFWNKELLFEGGGETLEFNSKLVKFSPFAEVARYATEISVSVPWPATLDDGAKLQVVFTGTPIWEGAAFYGIRIVRYQFRTRRAEHETAPIHRVAVTRTTLPARPHAPAIPIRLPRTVRELRATASGY